MMNRASDRSHAVSDVPGEPTSIASSAVSPCSATISTRGMIVMFGRFSIWSTR
jgi:hypothetical protein